MQCEESPMAMGIVEKRTVFRRVVGMLADERVKNCVTLAHYFQVRTV
jgi:hypothetical protein